MTTPEEVIIPLFVVQMKARSKTYLGDTPWITMTEPMEMDEAERRFSHAVDSHEDIEFRIHKVEM
jgi:hypothetical protein